jgi:hypothetical protein
MACTKKANGDNPSTTEAFLTPIAVKYRKAPI